MVKNDAKTEKGSVLLWLALVLAAASLWLSWQTYNKVSGERLEDLIKEQVGKAVEEVKKTVAREGKEKGVPAQEESAQ